MDFRVLFVLVGIVIAVYGKPLSKDEKLRDVQSKLNMIQDELKNLKDELMKEKVDKLVIAENIGQKDFVPPPPPPVIEKTDDGDDDDDDDEIDNAEERDDDDDEDDDDDDEIDNAEEKDFADPPLPVVIEETDHDEIVNPKGKDLADHPLPVVIEETDHDEIVNPKGKDLADHPLPVVIEETDHDEIVNPEGKDLADHPLPVVIEETDHDEIVNPKGKDFADPPLPVVIEETDHDAEFLDAEEKDAMKRLNTNIVREMTGNPLSINEDVAKKHNPAHQGSGLRTSEGNESPNNVKKELQEVSKDLQKMKDAIKNTNVKQDEALQMKNDLSKLHSQLALLKGKLEKKRDERIVAKKQDSSRKSVKKNLESLAEDLNKVKDVILGNGVDKDGAVRIKNDLSKLDFKLGQLEDNLKMKRAEKVEVENQEQDGIIEEEQPALLPLPAKKVRELESIADQLQSMKDGIQRNGLKKGEERQIRKDLATLGEKLSTYQDQIKIMRDEKITVEDSAPDAELNKHTSDNINKSIGRVKDTIKTVEEQLQDEPKSLEQQLESFEDDKRETSDFDAIKDFYRSETQTYKDRLQAMERDSLNQDENSAQEMLDELEDLQTSVQDVSDSVKNINQKKDAEAAANKKIALTVEDNEEFKSFQDVSVKENKAKDAQKHVNNINNIIDELNELKDFVEKEDSNLSYHSDVESE